MQLEACENYQKQSYRNRCYILAGDGVQMLQVPVQHNKGEVPLNIQNVLVDYSTPWVVRTERALDTAYETAAYYEYYRDDVFAVLNAQPETLWELNLATIGLLLEKTGISCTLSPTSAFAAPGTSSIPSTRTRCWRRCAWSGLTIRYFRSVWAALPPG